MLELAVEDEDAIVAAAARRVLLIHRPLPSRNQRKDSGDSQPTTNLSPLCPQWGYSRLALRQQGAPVRSRVCFTEPAHCDDPVGALLDIGVGILAGCEVVAQIKTRSATIPCSRQPGVASVLSNNRRLHGCWMRVARPKSARCVRPTKAYCAGQARFTSTTSATTGSAWTSISRPCWPANGPKAARRATSRRKKRDWASVSPVAAIDYREVLLSQLYPGAQTSLASLQPGVCELQRLLPLTWTERRRTLIRLDAGFGDDANLSWLLPWGYQVLAKGYSGKRAVSYARRLVPRRAGSCPGRRWLAWSPVQVNLGWPTRTVAVRGKRQPATSMRCTLRRCAT